MPLASLPVWPAVASDVGQVRAGAAARLRHRVRAAEPATHEARVPGQLGLGYYRWGALVRRATEGTWAPARARGAHRPAQRRRQHEQPAQLVRDLRCASRRRTQPLSHAMRPPSLPGKSRRWRIGQRSLAVAGAATCVVDGRGPSASAEEPSLGSDTDSSGDCLPPMLPKNSMSQEPKTEYASGIITGRSSLTVCRAE